MYVVGDLMADGNTCGRRGDEERGHRRSRRGGTLTSGHKEEVAMYMWEESGCALEAVAG